MKSKTRDTAPTLDRMLRLPAVEALTGLKRTAIQDAIDRGEFPRPVFLSDGGRAKAWLESELCEWQAQRIAAREAKLTARASQKPKPKAARKTKP